MAREISAITYSSLKKAKSPEYKNEISLGLRGMPRPLEEGTVVFFDEEKGEVIFHTTGSHARRYFIDAADVAYVGFPIRPGNQ